MPGGQARSRKLGGHAARALCAARAAAQGQHGVRHLVHALDAPGREEWIALDISFSSISAYLNDVGIGQHGYCFLMDQSGNIIYHPQQQLIYSDLKRENTSLIAGLPDGSNESGSMIYTLTSLENSHWRVVGVSFVEELITESVQEVSRILVASGIGILLAAVIINQLAQHLMPVKRASPSLSFTDITKVSDVISFPTKDASKDSFPGDHGMMLLIFASFMWRYFGRRAFAIALVIFVLFAFPRVMIGAHWFTDIAVGSLTAVLIGAPWVLMTPLSDNVIALFERYLPGRKTKN